VNNSKHSAVASFTKLLKLKPGHPDASVLLGADLIRLKHVDQAISVLRKYLDTNPNNPAGTYWLAIALTEKEEYLSSIPLFEKLASKNQLPAEGWLRRGRALLALGRVQSSLASAQRATELNPALQEAHELLGEIIMKPEASGGFHVLVVGGVGDILQCVPFLLDARTRRIKVTVMSHFKDAASLFDHLAIQIDSFIHFSSPKELRQKSVQLRSMAKTVPCPRRWHLSESPFSGPRIIFCDDRPVLGLHLGGSSYSMTVHRQRWVPTKLLPVGILHGLMSSNQFNIILFGTKEEIASFGLQETERLKFACFERVADSLAVVSQCAAFVGSDSAIKTMTAMLGIPTVVWHADHHDSFRDNVFIAPYVEKGVMRVFRYKNVMKDISDGIRFTNAALADFGVY
jgi:hypothetical protein